MKREILLKKGIGFRFAIFVNYLTFFSQEPVQRDNRGTS